MRKIIAERLEEERERLKKKKGEMASAAGVAGSAYTNYLNGDRSPDADFLCAIAAIGADVQYILTGVRSANALAPDEQLLLERYRHSPPNIQAAALQVVLVGEQGSTSPGVVIHGDNKGQSYSFTAPISGADFSIDMRKEKKRPK